MKRAFDDETVAKLRRGYRRLQEGGYNTSTFVKVQARNHGSCTRTVLDAIKARTYKHVEEKPA